MTVPGKGGSPLSPNVPEVIGRCPIHGNIFFRLHKIGFTPTGKQRYRARCPKCHAEKNARLRKQVRTDDV